MIDPRSFRHVMSCFATGIAVATTHTKEGTPVGITVNSMTSVSLEPPLVLFCLDRTARSYPLFKNSKQFALNILGDKQEDISRYFADPHHHKNPKNVWDKPQTGCPILRSTVGWMVCKTIARHKGGDHDIFVGEVIKLFKRSGQRDPLLYFHGRYRVIGV
jgi:flavin reductase (DIM6/NTAB) family NADH-FMN oxidoreductase RutF